MTLFRLVRSQKLQNECSPNFSNFRPEFLPRILLRIFPEFFEDFSRFVSWETETRKIHQKIPPFFNAKFPGKHEKNIHKMFLESRHSKTRSDFWISGLTCGVGKFGVSSTS